MNEPRALPPFEFSNGYDLTGRDLADEGIMITLSDDEEGSAAIHLPAAECAKFIQWMRLRIGKRGTEPALAGQTVKQYHAELVQAAIKKRVQPDLNILYVIIEQDIGCTKEYIKAWNHKTRDVAFVRAVLCFILRHRFNLSSPQIANILEAKSHASAIIAFRKFDAENINKFFFRHGTLLDIYKEAKRRYKKKVRLKC